MFRLCARDAGIRAILIPNLYHKVATKSIDLGHKILANRGVTESAICEQMFLDCKMWKYINISGAWRITHSLVTKLTEIKISLFSMAEIRDHREQEQMRKQRAHSTSYLKNFPGNAPDCSKMPPHVLTRVMHISFINVLYF